MLVIKPTPGFEPHRYDVVKLNADGSINEEFADNIYEYISLAFQAHRFGNRILFHEHTATSSEDPQSITSVYLDGTPDRAFNMPLEVYRYTKLYSDNDTELFVIRHVGSKPLVKLTYAPAPAVARTSAQSQEEPAIRFYPNPVKDKVTVSVTARSTVNIIDNMGLPTLSVPVDENSNTIDLNQLKPGRYVIEVVTGNNRYKEHFVKE